LSLNEGLRIIGKFVDGQWFTEEDLSNETSSVEYQRSDSVVRSWISESSEFPLLPEMDRYHPFLAYNCPWAGPVAKI